MSDPTFIHLRLHSAYSLLEGAISVKDAVKYAQADNMPAIAVTDSNNLFGALEFSEAAKNAGIQPIMGCQLSLKYSEQEKTSLNNSAPIVLLAQNEEGYLNLLKLSSAAYLDAGNESVSVPVETLFNHSKGLICLTGAAQGPFGQLILNNQMDAMLHLFEQFKTAFQDRLYIEVQRHNQERDAKTERSFIELAYAHNLPLVATNDVYFPQKKMFAAHDALLCIAEGTYVDQQENRRHSAPEYYFKTQEEMARLFADIPEALENTIEIAKRCAYRAQKRAPILPKFADDEVEELRLQARKGLKARLEKIEHSAPVKDYEERLEFELNVIEKMGFPGYFLIVADFIKWAKDNHIPVGPGRGSGAGSLVAYALTITDLDPLRYSLLFERFLNPERISMPDFDIDFCMDRREEVIHYVQDTYGHDKVAQIITFGALLSKMVIRDVGRVLQMPYGQVDRLAKMIPVEGVKPVSIQKALADEPRLKEASDAEEVVKRLLDYAEQLEGLLRNASTHAAGVVIADRPLQELVPLYKDPRSTMAATQFNMKWVEQAGLVKFDFLGLKTLTVVQGAVDFLKQRGIELDIGTIPLDDEASYQLYQSAKTVAVFQVESAGMIDALKQMRPTVIEDIIALVALYRPGPMENIPQYCDVKNKRAKREKLHPSIDHLLDETQGIIVYQEQVMQIAQEMAGYSLGGADQLRRAMGKKIQSEMDAQKPIFIEGAKKNGVDEAKAKEVWDLLNKFANYGFNKSHAAAYAVVSYQTAYLKANYPVEFMASVMNCDLHLTDKLNIYAKEAQRLGINLIPPCVNRSQARFALVDGQIAYALGGLKNVGAEAMELIVKARGKKPFKDLNDFATRVDLKRIGKRALEMLARAGAFDKIEPNRKQVFSNIDSLTRHSTVLFEEKNSSQAGLFGDLGNELAPLKLLKIDDWSLTEKLEEEHSAIGFYLSGHPLDEYAKKLKNKGVQTYQELSAMLMRDGSTSAKIAGTVAKKKERKSAKGNKFAFVELSDSTGFYEVTFFADILEKNRPLLQIGQNLELSVEATYENEQVKLIARSVRAIDDALLNATPDGFKIYLECKEAVMSLKTFFDDMKEKERIKTQGLLKIIVNDRGALGDIELDLPHQYPINLQVKADLRQIKGILDVEEW